MSGEALREVLLARRDAFNARFAAERRRRPALDGDLFGLFLLDTLAPIADAIAVAAPEGLGNAVDVLYDVALPLVANGVLSQGAVRDGWERLLPGLAGPLARSPRRVAGAVTNALHNLERVPGAKPARFVDSLLRAREHLKTADALLAAGEIAAWTSGDAPRRERALVQIAALPGAALTALFDLAEPLPDAARDRLAEGLRSDPFASPAEAAGLRRVPVRALRLVGRPGGFRGFGGPFLAPPIVTSAGGALYALGGGGASYRLAADVFGCVLLRATAPPVKPGPSRFTVSRGGVVTRATEREGKLVPSESETFPDLVSSSAQAGNAHCLAATHPFSHRVHVVAFAPESAP
ncbi:MAG: hypothetical protein JNK60_13820 [Acidobacteria bacterium]|nr:hypothetical protein [Acidobacteriota bacterium]